MEVRYIMVGLFLLQGAVGFWAGYLHGRHCAGKPYRPFDRSRK